MNGESWTCPSCYKPVPNGPEHEPTKRCTNLPCHGRKDCSNNGYGNVVGFGELQDSDDNVYAPQILVKLLEHNVRQFACGDSGEILALTRQGEVLSWNADDEWEDFPVRKEGLEAFTTHIEAGAHHFIALSSVGNIYVWGEYFHNDSGKSFRHIPLSSADDNEERDGSTNWPVQLVYEPKKKAKSISSGLDFCAVHLEDNTMLTFGIGIEGQMARPVPGLENASIEALNADHLYPKPPLWENGMPRKVLSRACGYDHLLVVAENQEVYSSGVNNYGQLGHGDVTAKHELTKINSLVGQDIAQVAAGDSFSYFVDQTGRKISACGKGCNGQLGLPLLQGSNPMVPSSSARKLPCRVPLIYNSIEEDQQIVEEAQPIAKQISCGKDHVQLLTSSGELYSWGNNKTGKCGHGKSETVVWRPKKLELKYINEFLHVSAGRYSSLGVAMVDEEFLSLTKHAASFVRKRNPEKIARVAPMLASIVE